MWSPFPKSCVLQDISRCSGPELDCIKAAPEAGRRAQSCTQHLTASPGRQPSFSPPLLLLPPFSYQPFTSPSSFLSPVTSFCLDMKDAYGSVYLLTSFIKQINSLKKTKNKDRPKEKKIHTHREQLLTVLCVSLYLLGAVYLALTHTGCVNLNKLLDLSKSQLSHV